jgi:hypothetical protein
MTFNIENSTSQELKPTCTGMEIRMCRNIKTLFNFEPPATDAEIRQAALQFVRKISGVNKPSAVNQAVFQRAVDSIADSAAQLLSELVTRAPARNREAEAAKAQARRNRQGRFQD